MRNAAWPLVLVLALAGATAGAGTLGRQAEARVDAPSVAATTSVRSLYIVHCAGCHGRDAAGSTVGNVPDMRRLGQFLQLDGGREFVIKVPGVMGSGLSDQQVADVTNWLLATLAPGSAPAGHVPYDAAEVRRARETPLVDVAAARQRLLTQERARGVTID